MQGHRERNLKKKHILAQESHFQKSGTQEGQILKIYDWHFCH